MSKFEIMTTEIQIHPELQNLIPPLTGDEFLQLEKNLLEDGIREPLMIAVFKDETGWEQEYLCDGHNRYRIAQKHKLVFEVFDKVFATFDDVKMWIAKNQIGRRNLSPKHFKILLGRIYNETKKKKGPPIGSANAAKNKVTKNVTLKTHQKVAEDYDVAEQTVINAGQYQYVLEQIAAEENKSQYEVYDEIQKDKHLKAIKNKKQKEPEKSWSQCKIEVLDNAKKQYQKKQEARTKVKKELKELSLLDFVGNKKFRVIYADPPWQYGDKRNINGYSSTDDHYITMSLNAICEMPVKQICEKNAVLFLWVTSPFLEDSFKVIKQWGFQYKTSFVWDKEKHNMGHYNSVRHEFLLIAVRGSCTPDVKKLFPSVQRIRKLKHSEKPEEFRKIIDTLYNWGGKIELFGRKSIENWIVFGNQKNEKQ